MRTARSARTAAVFDLSPIVATLPQPHASAFAVGVDDDNPGRLERPLNRLKGAVVRATSAALEINNCPLSNLSPRRRLIARPVQQRASGPALFGYYRH